MPAFVVSGARSLTIKRVRAASGYRLDFLFLVSRVIITLPDPLFRGIAVTKVSVAPILRRDRSLFQITRSRVLYTLEHRCK